jgi:O-antigen/teichoic acid export membrane protein
LIAVRIILAIISGVHRVFGGPARRNAAGSLLIHVSQRISRLAVIVVAAAVLTPAAFAALALALALADLVRGALQAFDVDAVRELTQGADASSAIQANIDAKLVAGAAGLLVVTATAALIDAASIVWLVVVAGCGALAVSFAGSFLVRHQALMAVHSVSSQVAVAGFAGTLLAVVLVWLLDSALAVVAGLAAGEAWLLILVGRGHSWRYPQWRRAVADVARNRRLIVMQLAHIGQFRLGTVVLGAFGSAVAVAEYSIASRMLEGLVVLAVALTASSLPMMGAARGTSGPGGPAAIFERSYRVGLAIVAPLVTVLIIGAPLWIDVLFPLYPDVGLPAAVVGLAVVVVFASSQTTALLNATHHDPIASRSALNGLVISVLGSLALVPFGAAGMAGARVVGELVRLVSEVAGLRQLEVPPRSLLLPWVGILPVLASAALAVTTSWQPPGIWIAAVLGLAGTAALSRTYLRARG